MSEASAPGKLVIVGEYAVLHGAPAIAIAVDVRARARVALRTHGGCVLSGESPGEQWPFTWTATGTPHWEGEPPEGRGRVVDSLLEALRDCGASTRGLPAVEVALDSSGFFRGKGEQRRKLGLGSSAAVTVALAGAFLDCLSTSLAADSAALPTAIDLALDAHCRLQDGAGSGIDIAAAGAGGVISLARRPGANPTRQALSFPGGLHWLALWTGYSASTTEMLGQFSRFTQAEPRLSAAHLDDLRAIAEAALRAWDRADVANLLCALAEYDAALRRLDRDAGIGIYSPAHHRLAELARRHGAIYKPSGAGGGDFGIAFASSAPVIERVQEAAYRDKLFTLAGGAGAPGLEVN